MGHGALARMTACLLLLSGCQDYELSATDGDRNGPGIETTRFRVTLENVSTAYDAVQSGGFQPAPDAPTPDPVGPGEAFTFDFVAGPGARLQLVTAWLEGNDLFYAFEEDGLALYGRGQRPRTGDVTGHVYLWDAGTRSNLGTSVGSDIPDGGPGEGLFPWFGGESGITRIDSRFGENDPWGIDYPVPEEVVQVLLEHDGTNHFTVTVRNVADAPLTVVPSGERVEATLSAGAYVVHPSDRQLFFSGEIAPDEIALLATTGNPGPLVGALEPLTGVTSVISPLVWAVHERGPVAFREGMVASEAVEVLAELGRPEQLQQALGLHARVSSVDTVTVPDGAADPRLLEPRDAYTFEVAALPGERLTVLGSWVQGNDVLLGTLDRGLPLFEGGEPRSGDVTAWFRLYDAGTEQDEQPGVGLAQVLRQRRLDQGEDEEQVLRSVDGDLDGFDLPLAEDVVRVTLEPLPGDEEDPATR